MKVKTDFEVKHFITYINMSPFSKTVKIVGKDSEGMYHTNVGPDEFYIHEDALVKAQVQCPRLKVENRMLQ